MAQSPMMNQTDPSVSASGGAPRNFWLRLTSYYDDRGPATIERRELVRRSQLMSWVALGLLVALLMLLPIGLIDPLSLDTVVALFVAVLIAIVLNRQGLTTLSGILVIIALDCGALVVLLRQVGGLPLDALPLYDLLVSTVVIGATVLPRGWTFIIAALNSAFIIGDYARQPHGADLIANAAFYQHSQQVMAISLLARPIALEVIVAVIAFLWVRSTDTAIRRADRAEEIASLEHSLAEQKRQLDLGIDQILQTHVRAANGDYSARTPLGQDNVLWQISVSLNNLLSRIQRTNQAEYMYQRTQEEIGRIVAALDDLQAGRHPVWPAPTGTIADPLLERLVRAANTSTMQRTPSSQPQGQGFGQPFSHPMSQPYGQLPGQMGSQPFTPPAGYPRDPGASADLPTMQPPMSAPFSGPNAYRGPSPQSGPTAPSGLGPFGGQNPPSAPYGVPVPRAPQSGTAYNAPEPHQRGGGAPSGPSNPWAFPMDDEENR